MTRAERLRESGDSVELAQSRSSLDDFEEEDAVDETQEVKKLIETETRHVRLWRFNVFFTLGIAACTMSSLTYVFLNWVDKDDFDSSFSKFALTIEDATEFNLRGVVDASSGLGEVMTSEAAKATQTNLNSRWPFFTLSSFEVFTSSTRAHARTELVVVCPLVEQADLEEWATYSQNNQNWIDESFTAQGNSRSDLNPIPTAIYRFGRYKGRTILKPEDGETDFPSAPFWTMSPPPFDTSIVNYNALDDADNQAKYTSMIETRAFVMGRAKKTNLINYAISQEDHDLLHGSTTTSQTQTEIGVGFADEHPHTELMYPVFEKLRDQTSPIVAYIVSVLPWDNYLKNLLPPGINGIYCVLHNSCGQKFTYMINGNEAVFVGAGDAHETAFDEYEYVIDFNTVLGRNRINETDPTDQSDCHYWFSIYPSAELESSYQTKIPVTVSLCVGATFLFMTIIFFIYDLLVIRKNEKILNAAARSNTIVSSLFPSEVRDRLYQETEEKNKATRKRKGAIGDWRGEDLCGDESESDLLTSKPNAEVYQECTVLFADLVGFTRWSSTRDPTAVFTLLENLYKQFDLIAKRRRIFKVETVGDCYVAVSGLPDPRKDHAMAIARFAQDCLVEMPAVLAKLEEVLGAGTLDLSMRFGLNSGPVTAGVLRGQKGRFQLFGDTVNVAARMETTGERGRIHLSQTTADLISSAGRGHWLTARDETIVAKGKGEMQTYWLSVRNNSGSDKDMDTSTYQKEEIQAAGEPPVATNNSPPAIELARTSSDAPSRSDASNHSDVASVLSF